MMSKLTPWGLLFLIAAALPAMADDYGLQAGAVELRSAGPLAFGPDGILMVGDPKAATIYAIDTEDQAGVPAKVSHQVANLNWKIGKSLKPKNEEAAIDAPRVSIADMAVNPTSGNLYLSVSSDKQPNALLFRVTTAGRIERLKLDKTHHAKVVLPNPPADKVTGEGRRRRNRREESITDLAFIDGKVIVSGLSSAESPSTVRELNFPFAESDDGVSLEIFHGAHGRFEDYAPVRTFIPLKIGGEINVLAGFTCTPLVRIPLSQLTAGKKVRGTTVAELGNHNRPLDMIVYEKDDKSFLLMANSARGVMKIPTAGLEKQAAITERVGGVTAGQSYETIDELKNVVQLDRLNDGHAVVLIQSEGGGLDLQTIELP